ncbi:hypothetical protein [Streptomyces sp. NPDC051909]|uniref:hypothetical protein n=1 Tax=Streptomyces sp. NPDC051909 TaxID=3154944 RepID=UPI00343EF1F5
MTNTRVEAAGRLLREMLGAGRDTADPGPGSGAALRAVAADVAAAGGADDETAPS